MKFSLRIRFKVRAWQVIWKEVLERGGRKGRGELIPCGRDAFLPTETPKGLSFSERALKREVTARGGGHGDARRKWGPKPPLEVVSPAFPGPGGPRGKG